MEGAYEIMVEMEKKRIFLDDVTHNMLMRGFCWLGQLDETRRLIDEMKRMGIHPDFVIHNMLISGYSMKGGWSNVIVDSAVTHFYGALEVAYKRNGVPALLAEVKKATPSRGVLMEDFNTVEIVQPYEKNGAACLSILTDKRYFQGSFENLEKICEELGITALIEVHDGREMERVLNINGVKLTSINNRSLETFVLYTSNTKMLLKRHGITSGKREFWLLMNQVCLLWKMLLMFRMLAKSAILLRVYCCIRKLQSNSWIDWLDGQRI
jgi:pentatricopeptide repeat protein